MSTLYPALKLLHVACAIASIGGFALRGVWAVAGSPLLQRRLVRILPHVIDTIFLLSGIALTLTLHQYPGTHAWLTAKVAGLLVYILLGTLTLRVAQRPATRLLALVLALATFAWIASVALTRDPAGLLARLPGLPL